MTMRQLTLFLESIERAKSIRDIQRLAGKADKFDTTRVVGRMIRSMLARKAEELRL